ncbi:RHS repeat-associated core domain-containing protein [Vreelandella sp.]|uniref:RHS repeat-associated core domain-containing protein n=1 Tax=Vreelandella sp. TaxID=3137778 RepID=UPI003BA92024
MTAPTDWCTSPTPAHPAIPATPPTATTVWADVSAKPYATPTATHYGWDGDRIVQEETNNQRTTVVYEPGSFVPMLRIDDTPQGQLLSAYVTDALGTPMQLINADGETAWKAQPDDWAAVQHERGNTTQLIRFQGQWHDEESGLYYNRHRYYDPQQGRYISQDPIGLNGGTNLYGYVTNPTGMVDPLGLRNRAGPYGLGSLNSQSNMVRRSGNELEASLSGGLTGQAFGGITGISTSRNRIMAPNGTFNSSTVCWQLGVGVYAGGGGAGTLNLSSAPVSPGVSDSLGAFFSGGAGPLGGGGNIDLASNSLSTAKAFLGPGIGAAGGLQFCRTWVHEREGE